MAETKKKRKRPDSTASGQSSFMSEEPISSCSESSVRSQMSTAESTAPSHVSMKRDRSISPPLNFGHVKTQRLSGCQITEAGCASLAKALKSNPSHLIELDLSYNHPGVSGEDQLSELKRDPHYKLNTLNVEHGGSHRMKPGFKKYACELTLDPNTAHKNLHLSEGNRKVTWVEEEQSYGNH